MMEVGDLFETKYGVNLEYYQMEQDPAGIPFVSRKARNNGVQGNVKRQPYITPNPANTISLAVSGSVMSSYLQETEYYSGRDVYWLKPRQKLDKPTLRYYCMVLRHNDWKYAYGRQANKTFAYLRIPAPDEIPKWVYEVKLQQPRSQPQSQNKISLQNRRWSIFRVGDIFSGKSSKTTSIYALGNYTRNGYPYVTTQSSTNGVVGLYSGFTEIGNCICIDSAVVGFASYQEKNFSASDHVEMLRPQNSKINFNVFIALFISTILNRETYKYNYGRKRSISRLLEEQIRLPITKTGDPDWQFMEDYIKSLPYSSNLS